MGMKSILTFFSAASVIMLIFQASASAQTCLTTADQPPCDGIVDMSEIRNHIDAWLTCSSCVTDFFDAIQSFYGIHFCGDHSCDGVYGEDCNSCKSDCGECVFGIYTANLDGSGMELIHGDSYREMTHSRVSPNKQLITYSTYNNVQGHLEYFLADLNDSNCATQVNSTWGSNYLNTEVLVMNISSKEVKSLFSPDETEIYANSYWVTDNSLVYLYANSSGSEIRKIFLDENMDIINETKLDIPAWAIAPTDPQQLGNKVVFPALFNGWPWGRPGLWLRGIVRMNENGSGAEILTLPRNLSGGLQSGFNDYGDVDPKISPDGTKVAFMRYTDEDNWHSYIVNVNDPLNEIDISEQHIPVLDADGVPEWLNNEKIIFWYVNWTNFWFGSGNVINEIYVMNYTGGERMKVPLPEGYRYTQPSLFEGDGYSDNTKILFSAKILNLSCKCTKDADCLTHPGGDSCDVDTGQCDVIAAKYEKINIIGEESTMGIGDPALEYESDGKVGWMSYSTVWPLKYVNTSIAKTTDHGKTWTKILEVNPSEDGTVLHHNGSYVQGNWRNEVSTIVYDPDDVPSKRWKLFWHKYFIIPPYNYCADCILWYYGWIAYKDAPSPDGPWSDEVPLFGTGGTPLPPYNTTRFNLSSLHEDLQNVFFATEPGSLYKDGILYLSLSTIEDSTLFGRNILISSDDHGNNWRYVGTLADDNDAQDLGFIGFCASSLVEVDGKEYAFFDKKIGESKDFIWSNGSVIFEFDDITQAKLKRDYHGKLTPIKSINRLKENLMGGTIDYDKYNTYGGILTSQVTDFDDLIDVFQIYSTKQRIVDE